MAIQILIYWLIAQLLGLAGLPLARLVLGALPERGYAFSKPLGLLATGTLAWLLAMLGLASFSAGLVAFCAVLICGLGMLAHPEGRPRPILAWLRERWRPALAYELVFMLALIWLAVQRSYDIGFVGPNPWGTERPMDFAFFNAIGRSPSFPPHDPWMAGYSINYYYLGYLLMSAVALLSGLPPGVAYNLSLALIFALTAQGVAGMVLALACLTRGARRAGRRAWSAAALAVVMVLLAGNQGGALQVLSGTNAILALDGPDMARAVLNGIGPRQELALARTYNGDVFGEGGSATIRPSDRLADFDWWWPSRALWDTVRDEAGIYSRYAITEFPFFSFWLGDMHPHVMALPFGLLALALALHTVARKDLPAYAAERHGWAELLCAGAILGGLYVINSWDFPTYLLLFLAALLLRYARAPGPIAWRAYGLQSLVVVVAALALFLPFYLTFKSLVGAKEPLLNIPVLSTLSRTISLVGLPKTPLQTFLIIFGLFFLPTLIWAAWALGRHGWNAWWIATLAALVAGLLLGFPLVALAPLAFYAGQAALRHARGGRPAEAFVLAAFALACAICFGTDVIYIRDVFDTRMNTIFKFYYQAWLILGVLAGYSLWALFERQAYRTAELQNPEGYRTAELQNHGTEHTEHGAQSPEHGDDAASHQLPATSPNAGDPPATSPDAGDPPAIGPEPDEAASQQLPATSPEAGDPPATSPDAGDPPDISSEPDDAASHQLPATSPEAGDPPARPSMIHRLLALAIFLPLLAGALAYPALTLRQLARDGTLVGLNGITPRERTPDGAAAIEWLRRNAPGNAVIVEAVGDSAWFNYDTEGRGIAGVSASTGLAAVMGWSGHQNQWRGGDPSAFDQIQPRREDVVTIYSTTDTAQARALLEKYRVRYIYVGPAERALYPPEGLAKLEQLGTPVFQQGDTTIFQIG